MINAGLGAERGDFLLDRGGRLGFAREDVERGQACERGLRARVDELRGAGGALGGGRVALGEAGIGFQSQRIRVLRVHREGPVGHAARGRGIELGQREHALSHQRLDRARIDLERLIEGIRGIGAVVFLQEEIPRLHFGLPAVGIGLQGVLVDLVEDERELRRACCSSGRSPLRPVR